MITTDGAVPPFPGGSTAKFQMRAVGSSTLKVNAAATSFVLATGAVTYDPAALDVDTAGFYVAWWQVTLPGGLIQETPEFLIEIRAHAPGLHDYISAAELKETLSLKESYADADVQDAVTGASRVIDRFCRRAFYLGSPGEVRTYTPVSENYVLIDDATAITAVTNRGTAVVLTTEYLLTPPNAPAWSEPYTVLRSANGYLWPRGVQNGVTVTGTFGWATVPAVVKQAAKILASRLLLRSRQAVFGVVGLDFDGAAVRIGSTDPDLALMLNPLRRSGMIE